MRHFLDLANWSANDIMGLLDKAIQLKTAT